jgi:hypothetical protein
MVARNKCFQLKVPEGSFSISEVITITAASLSASMIPGTIPAKN